MYKLYDDRDRIIDKDESLVALCERNGINPRQARFGFMMAGEFVSNSLLVVSEDNTPPPFQYGSAEI